MATPLQAPYAQFFDSNGDPLSGGKVYTYIAGTTTPKATYTDAAGGTPAANPIILDSSGRAEIWITGTYRIDVYTSADVLVRSVDNVPAFTAGGDMTKAVYDAANIAQQVVGLTASQSLTNKSVNGVTLTTGGSATQFLNGAGSYAAPVITPTATPVALSGTSSTITVDFTTYSEYELIIDVTAISGNVTIEASSNGGGAYASTTYKGTRVSNTTASSQTTSIYATVASDTTKLRIAISQPSTSGAAVAISNGAGSDGTNGVVQTSVASMGVSAVANRIRISVGTSWTGYYTIKPIGTR